MSRRYSAAELRDLADTVIAFRAKLEELLTHTVQFGAGPVGHWQVPREGHQHDVERLAGEVSTLAGSAQVGAALTGTFFDTSVENQRTRINPISAWATILQPKPVLQPEDVLTAARHTEGKLRADARTALREERSLAGRVAAVIRFPSRVREIAGFERGSPAGRATEWSVSVLMAGVLTSLLASALWALLE